MTFELSSIHLGKLIKNNPVLRSNTQGIFPSDKIPCNVIPGKFYIINADSSTEEGSHWLSIYFPKEGLPEFFDSLGKCPSYYSFNIFDSLICHNSRGFVYNSKRIQNLFSSCCGLYCLYFIYFRSKDISFGDMFKHFGEDLTRNDFIIKCFYNRFLSDILKE